MIKQFIFGLITVFSLFGCSKEIVLTEKMEDNFYLRKDGADLPVFVYGNGASKVFILIVHGGPGGNGLDYRLGKAAEELEKNYAVVYTDQRHQGNSQDHFKEKDFTTDAMVEDIHYLIRVLKERYGNDISLFMLGHSWGGTLGTAYLIKEDYQHDLKGWIEMDGAHDFPLMLQEQIKMILEIGNAENNLGRNSDKWEPILTYVNGVDTNNISFNDMLILNQYAHEIENLITAINPPEVDVKFLDYYFTSPHNPLAAALNSRQIPTSFLEELQFTSYTDKLNLITIPTLIQAGKFDFVVPPAVAYSAFSHIGSTEKSIHIYTHSGHTPMINEPDLFSSDIITFIEAYR